MIQRASPCGCEDGIEKSATDGRRCGPDAVLLRALRDQIRSRDLVTGENDVLLDPGHDAGNIQSIAVHSRRKLVFYSVSAGYNIHVYDLETKETKSLVRFSTGSVVHLEIDYITNKIYWLDGKRQQISVTTLEGEYETKLPIFNLTGISTFTIAPTARVLFLADNTAGIIYRVGMDGRGKRDILRNSEELPIAEINSLLVHGDALYWSDTVGNYVGTSTLDGNLAKKLQVETKYPRYLAAYEGTLYITER
eukprot:sb/3468768/